MKKTVKFLFLNCFSLLGRPLREFFKTDFPKEVSSILVFAGSHIGDIIRLLPAIRALHLLFPQAKLTILSSHKREFFGYFSEGEYISHYIFYNPQNEHKSFLKKLLLIRELRRLKFDLIFVPTRGIGMCENAIIAALIGAPYRIGFEYKGCGFLNNIKRTFKENIPILKQNLLLLGRKNFNEKINIILPERDIKFASHLLGKKHPVISIHPGVDWKAEFRSWPKENFAELIKIILNKYQNVKVVVLGSNKERYFSQLISSIRTSRMIDLIGKTTLGQMMAVIKYSHLFIGNDSGPLHIARAFKIPTVGIFGPTDPRQVVSDWENFVPVYKRLSCWPCYHHQPFFRPTCKIPICLREISISDVTDAIGKLKVAQLL